jgi:hypothetical protein
MVLLGHALHVEQQQSDGKDGHQEQQIEHHVDQGVQVARPVVLLLLDLAHDVPAV